MIGRLQGLLLAKDHTEILLDVQGVAYEVEVSLTTLFQLPDLGQNIVLFTHFVVREDAQLLYGFIDLKDRSLFRLMLRVNGVGPKLALALLSHMDSSKFVASVMNNDVNALVKLPGVGRKTAERLIIELRDRLKKWEQEFPPITNSLHSLKIIEAGFIQEAESALVSLGYKIQEASRAVALAAAGLETSGQTAGTEQLIRLALKNIARASAG